MYRTSKIPAVVLTIIIAMSCIAIIMLQPASAQTPTISPSATPSVPEFTVKFVDASYNAAPSSTVDSYTGQNVTSEGHYVQNRTIELIIKNQPFTSYQQNGENISFYYNVRVKGQYDTNWTNVYTIDNYFTLQSGTDYTTLVYLIDANTPPLWKNLVNGGTVDFQVQAMIGYISRSSGFASWYFSGQSSDWSPTQTVTIQASSNSPTPSATVSELPWLAIVPLILIVVAVAVVLRYRKTAKHSQ